MDLRPITILVPDVSQPDFAFELRRQIASLDPDDEQETLNFIDALLMPHEDDAR